MIYNKFQTAIYRAVYKKEPCCLIVLIDSTAFGIFMGVSLWQLCLCILNRNTFL